MTISGARRTKIRSLFFAEHWKVGTIANELGVHVDTVKDALGTLPSVCMARSQQREPCFLLSMSSSDAEGIRPPKMCKRPR